MKRVTSIATAIVLAVLVGMSARVAAQNPVPSQRTFMTFSNSVEMPGVTLPAGTYVFEVVGTSGDVVRVSSKQGRHYFMGFTQRIERPAARGPLPIATLGEAPAGTPQPIEVWYPIGSLRGHRFLYPR